MRVKLEDWKNGWVGIDLAIDRDELDQLVHLLSLLKANPDQHFHLTSDYEGEGGVGDITICVQQPEDKSNMAISGFAVAAGQTLQ